MPDYDPLPTYAVAALQWPDLPDHLLDGESIVAGIIGCI
jgi:hypothetical protein